MDRISSVRAAHVRPLATATPPHELKAPRFGSTSWPDGAEPPEDQFDQGDTRSLEDRRAARRAALAEQTLKFVRRNTTKLTEDHPTLKPYADFAQLRPKEVTKLAQITQRTWLRHAYINSYNPELVQGMLLSLRKELPAEVPIIQVNGEAALKLLSNPGKLKDLLSSRKRYYPSDDDEGTTSGKAKKSSNVIPQVLAAFQQQYGIDPQKPCVLVINDVALNDMKGLSKKLKALDEQFPNLHLIINGKPAAMKEDLGIPMPPFIKQMMGAMQNAIGARMNNIDIIHVPHLSPDEWQRVLSSKNNPAGEVFHRILDKNQIQLDDDALHAFLQAVSVQYDEKPKQEDILAELDQFTAFVNRTNKRGPKTATSNDVQRYIREELGERNRSEDINPFEELGAAMQVPNPFKVLKHCTTTFSDVVGHEKAKEAIIDVLDPLNRALYNASSGNAQSNVTTVLLTGPPGTGKTELAKAAAGENQGTFITANASELINPFQASGSTNVKRLTKLVQSASSDVVVVFIDEIDAVGNRDTMGSGEEHRTLNSLLTSIQGAGTKFNKTVLFMFATNKPDSLDSAFLSRMQRQIEILPPNHEERKGMWQLHLAKNRISPDDSVNFDTLAKLSKDRVGRDISTMVGILKKQLIRKLPRAEKQRIVSDPVLLKNVSFTATQADITACIRLFNDEHSHGSAKRGHMGFVPPSQTDTPD